jgi:hypothetical protein
MKWLNWMRNKVPKRRLSRARHNVIARLNRRLSRICFAAHEEMLDAVSDPNNEGKPYEEVVRPIGVSLYSGDETYEIKKKLKALGVKGINL